MNVHHPVHVWMGLGLRKQAHSLPYTYTVVIRVLLNTVRVDNTNFSKFVNFQEQFLCYLLRLSRKKASKFNV